MPQQPINATSVTGISGVPRAGMPHLKLSNAVSQPPIGGGQQHVTIATASQLPVGGGSTVPAHSKISMSSTPSRSLTEPTLPAHSTQIPVTQPAGNIKHERIGKMEGNTTDTPSLLK